jgi:hypothetical protein
MVGPVPPKKTHKSNVSEMNSIARAACRKATAELFAAMAHHGLGRHDEAGPMQRPSFAIFNRSTPSRF